MTQTNTVSTGECNTKTPPKSKQIAPSKHWVFTFNNYTQGDIKDIISISANSVQKYVFQEETGESGTKHLQGYICFAKRVRPKSLFSDKIHWERCRHIQASIDYCMKEDTRTGKIFSKGINIPKPIKILNPSKFYDWEKDIIKIIENETDDRTIYWFWESVGGIGKTVFCKYLAVKHEAIVIDGKASDMKYVIVKHIEKHGNYPRLIILNIPRAREAYLSYPGIEQVKDGIFCSTKYESSMVVGNCPHVICFANFLPDKEKLSKDRWEIKNIRGMGSDEDFYQLDFLDQDSYDKCCN